LIAAKVLKGAADADHRIGRRHRLRISGHNPILGNAEFQSGKSREVHRLIMEEKFD
jgi:hypothetical protein